MRRRTSRSLGFQPLEARAMLAGSLSGFVYTDLDADAVRDASEPGVPGVVVRLNGTPTGGTAIERSTQTDNNGFYQFTGIAPGTYQLTERQPSALRDGRDTTATAGVTATTNDQFANIVVTDTSNFTNNNFGEAALRSEFVTIRWFMTSSPALPLKLREAVALGEQRAGDAALAASIRAGGPAPDDDEDPPVGDNNVPFLAVTTGNFTDAGLLGTRTDLVTSAPAITSNHVTTTVDYSAHSNPPTYGDHHGVVGAITPRPTGVYTTEQPDEDLVHNLEHGHVWISYDPTLLSAADIARLEAFVTAGGTDNGVILTPRARNTTAVSVASWARLLTMTTLDLPTIRSFVNTNRGHAPEGFMPSGQKPASGGETLNDNLPHTPAVPDNNVPFASVTAGNFTDAGLSGTRTDLVTGAPAITSNHVTTAVSYSAHSNPPTYGDHHGVVRDSQNNFITPRPTGVYTTEQPDEDLVHNLEHGHVWISYDPTLLSANDRARLEAFVTAGGTDSGVILTPRARNTSAIAVASWARLTTMETLDLAAIRTFVNSNRGKSPEGFIPSGQKAASGGETLNDNLTHTAI